MQSLCFFDKEGNYLNFNYDPVSETYNGDLIFHENGSDTFKTIGIYTFERIPSFEFESNKLELEKFQLFNEYGFNITGNSYQNEPISRIEAVNNDTNFQSKWIYGVDFEKKYPIGSEICFNSPIFEFVDLTYTYTVVSSKKGAIMIVSSVDNKSFNINYQLLSGLTSSYNGVTIRGLNSIGINNYIDPNSLTENLSVWSQPNFQNLVYDSRKLNLVNTELNDSIVTVKNSSLKDKIYYDYYVKSEDIPFNTNVYAEIVLNTDLPIIYQGGLNILSDKIEFVGSIPSILKPGTQFNISGSINNQNFISVSNIPTFVGNTQVIYYATASQVLWNNKIYQSIVGYTQSAQLDVNPDNQSYWTPNITYLPVSQSLVPESILYGEVYLTTNKIYYGMSASGVTGSNNTELTLAFLSEKYNSDFSNLNISLNYLNKKLIASLDHSSKYATVNFYHTKIGSTYSIGSYSRRYENTIEIEETLKTEFNKDISQRNSYYIVFTDIDEYGILIDINGMIYQQEVLWVYSGSLVDMERTIDKTLKAWVSKNYVELYRLGIVASLDYLSNYPYLYADSISLKTVYPNVPIDFKIKVGTTADFFIQHSNVTFYEIGNVLSITINNKEYSLSFSSNESISEKLQMWFDEYVELLSEFEIYINLINNKLFFNIKEQYRPLTYEIFIGKNILPGENSFKIENRIEGNFGALITSNAAVLPAGASPSNFYDINVNQEGIFSFATGMIAGINNSVYPFNNQEYNLIEVKEERIVFSYQGPFWGGTASLTNSPFTYIAFDSGFTSSSTLNSYGVTYSIGSFSPYSFNYSFNTYDAYVPIIIDPTADSNPINGIVDILYVNTSEYIYILGSNIKIYDGLSGDFLDTLNIPGLTGSKRLEYNKYDGYLYLLSYDKLYKIDPFTYTIESDFSLSSNDPHDILVNYTNGEIFISYSNNSKIDVFTESGLKQSIVTVVGSSTYKMSYNKFENDIYVVTQNNIIRVDGVTYTQTIYSISSIGQGTSIVYEPVNTSIHVLGLTGSILTQINNGIVTTYPSVTGDGFSDMIYDSISNSVSVSLSSFYASVDNGSVKYNLSSSKYGYLFFDPYDERVYLAAQNSNEVLIIDPNNGLVKNKVINLPSNVTKLTYNPIRKTMWGIIPSSNKIVEIQMNRELFINVSYPQNYEVYNGIHESLYGTLDKNYKPKDNIWIKTRDYIRRPRENYVGEKSIQYVWKWATDDNPDIFLYDFTGNLLDKNGPYAYVGPKPLDKIYLNTTPNKNIGKTSSSEYQQTVFPEIIQELDYINSSYNVSYMPDPLQTFIGFKSEDEGYVSSTLQLLKRENIEFSIVTNSTNYNNIKFESKIDSKGKIYGLIALDTNSSENFLYDLNGNDRGLKVGQIIKIFVKDNTNTKNKFISFNNGLSFKIKELYFKSIVVKPTDLNLQSEETTVVDYPSNGKKTYMTTTFKVLDKMIGRFIISGQTEIEDVRYKTELTNAGKNITADDVFIFKTYDINEEGVDWKFLNLKRKELLIVKDSIYPYIGAYKSIINAINYFGYNDLELYEYYRNINIDSKDFGKLFKVEIPDIFDNSVTGWKESDFLKHTMPNSNYEDTNLFNLSYRITDREGNNVLLYSLPEVLIKLQGLKYWLQKNIIPISHKILDITGRADFVNQRSIVHKSYDAKIFNIKQSMSPFDFKLNEAYLIPVNSGSTVYSAVIDFYNQNLDDVPEYFTLKIRTYKTYPEWKPFKWYQSGSIVSYYQQIYESVIDNNRLNDPRKYNNVASWNINIEYQQGSIVEYKRNYYVFIGTQSTILNGTQSVQNPFVDVLNSNGYWKDITEWRKLDYVPVQTIKEFRTGTHSFNFTVDTNIDPFINVEVTSDNGYGQTYTVKKNYELRSILDIDEGTGELDEIGPIKIYNLLTSTTTSTTTKAPDFITFWEAIDPICEDNITTTTTTTTSTTTTTTTLPLDCVMSGFVINNGIDPTTTTTTTTTTSTTSTTTTTYSCGDFTLYGGPGPGRTFVFTDCSNTPQTIIVPGGDSVSYCIKLPYTETGAVNNGTCS